MKTDKKQDRHNKTALPRLYKIDREIALGKFPNSDDLAELCETSVSTISRDIEFMRDQLLAPIASDGNRDWLENRIVVPPVASAKVDTTVWETVIAGLKGNRVIIFDYLGTWDEDYQKRRIRPYQLLFDSVVWYLYGFAEERKAIRIFSLSRIKNAVLTQDKFQLPQNFSYTDLAAGSYFGVFIGQEKYQFVIECYDEAKIFATERQWADDQKITGIDDGVKIEFTSTQYGKVLKWLLSCGCDAIPQKPKKLIDDWKRHITEMNKLVSK